MNKTPPSGLYRCSECGKYRGFPRRGWFRGVGVACDCDNAWCTICGKRLSVDPIKNYYFEKVGKILHVAHFGATCPKIGTDTIIVTIRGIYVHDRAGHGLPESLHPATRIM